MPLNVWEQCTENRDLAAKKIAKQILAEYNQLYALDVLTHGSTMKERVDKFLKEIEEYVYIMFDL